MVESSLIKRILQDIKEIPPLPEVATRVLQLTNDPEVSAAELNQVISRDEALTANVLKLCNSAYYGLPRVIENRFPRRSCILGFRRSVTWFSERSEPGIHQA
ncbi:MAG: HDOD domain-containing protein [Candidatus Omnitrophica bacterium]|nr:HDOD domain-containing protein [Candidatus Omnitrophota bacterium]